MDFYLDPGNVHCQDRLDSLVSSISTKQPEQLKNGRVILRADSGYGAIKNIEKLMSIKGLRFIVKGYSSKKAAAIAKTVTLIPMNRQTIQRGFLNFPRQIAGCVQYWYKS